jgi:hypothetical protein
VSWATAPKDASGRPRVQRLWWHDNSVNASNPAELQIPRNHLWWVENGKLRARLHSGQTRTWNATERIVAMVAGSQGGKTSFGPLWLWREMKRRGPGDYLAVTATVPLSRLKMLPEFLRLFDHALHLGTWHKGDRVFEVTEQGGMRLYGTAEPSRIIFGSAVSPESLESATAKAAWLDEAGQKQFRLESYEAVQRRLALNQGRVLITTTPYNLGWLYTAIYQPWQRQEKAAKDDPNTERRFKVIQFRSSTNPSFPEIAMEEARISLPAWRYQLFYEGQFTKPEGLIYGAYTDDYYPNGHLVPYFEPSLDWGYWLGTDFGGANTAFVWITMDPNTGIYYLCNESLSGGKTTQEHVDEEILPVLRNHPLYAAVGGAPGETQQRMDYANAGVAIEAPEIIDVESGIDRTLQLLRSPNFRVMDNALGWRSEAGAYSRVLDVDGTPTEKIDQKAKFHRMDATRYIATKLTLYPYGTNMGMILIAGGLRGWGTRG